MTDPVYNLPPMTFAEIDALFNAAGAAPQVNYGKQSNPAPTPIQTVTKKVAQKRNEILAQTAQTNG